MKSFLKKSLAVVLALIMIIGLAACKKNKYKAEVIKKEDPFFADSTVSLQFPLDSDKELDSIYLESATLDGDKIHVLASISYYLTEDLYEDPNLDWNDFYRSGDFYFSLDGELLSYQFSEDDITSNRYTSASCKDNDGNTVSLLVEYDEEYNSVYYIEKTDSEGNVLSEAKAISGISDPNSTWFSKIMPCEDGSFILLSYGALYVIDANGSLLFDIQDSDISDYLFKVDGKFYVWTRSWSEDSTNSELKEIDFAGQKLGTAHPALQLIYSGTPIQGDNAIYVVTSNGICNYDIENDSLTEIMNWNSTDANRSLLAGASYFPVSDTEHVFITQEWVPVDEIDTALYGEFTSDPSDLDREIGVVTMVKLTKMDENPHAGKQILTLGGFDLSYSDVLMEQVELYNEDTSKPARIYIDDYSSRLAESSDSTGNMANMYSDAIDKIYLEMVAGEGADILVNMSTYPQFERDDILVDLNTYLDGENGINRDDYFDNVLRAFETDGKLYEMPVVFDLIGLMGSTALVGDRTGWTVDEFNQMVNSLPEGVLPFAGITQENILSNALSFSMSSFVNYGSGEVSFDSEDFIKLLDLAKTYGQDSSEISYGGDSIIYEDISTSYITGSEDGQDPYTLAQNGLLALMDAYLYSPDMIVNDQITFNGEVTYLGYPNPDKTGLSCQTTLSLAMSAMTEYKDEAWSFISYFLTPDAQADAAADAYSIALDRSVVDDQITQALENAETAGYYMSYGEDMPKLTQADCDRYLSVINAVSSRCISDVSIMAVITEEAAQYFNGQKSAEEVASSIQNRVQLIVDERN